MMVHDIFNTIDDFIAVMRARAVHPDLSAMFYMLHFKYPSVEKLWEFTCRAISGETWYVGVVDEATRREIERLGAFEPVSPYSLGEAIVNPRVAQHVFYALQKYMKWHDYARIPWRDGWPTDNAIIMELITDIPGKIDLRWMTRWGLGPCLGLEKVMAIPPLKLNINTAARQDVVANLDKQGPIAGNIYSLPSFGSIAAIGAVVLAVVYLKRRS